MGMQNVVLTWTMNTCLVFSFLVVLLGLTWAQGIKPQFSIDKVCIIWSIKNKNISQRNNEL